MRLKPGAKVYWRAIVGTMALGYQRRHAGSPGRWIARSYVGDEKYRQTPIAMADDYEPSNGGAILTFEEASERVRQSHRTNRDRPLSVLTVADAIADYIIWLTTHRATWRAAGQTAVRHILPTLGKIRLNELTTRQLIDWRDKLAERPALFRSRAGAPQNYRPTPTTSEGRRARRATANRIWTVLRAALNRAFVDGHVATDIAWRRVKPFEQVAAARPGHLTAGEAARLVNASEPAFRALVRGALETGARYGELAGAKVRDFQAGKLHIARSKSGRARNVVLSDAGAACYASLPSGRAPDEPIFLHRGRPWQKSNQVRPMKAACVRARIAPPITFHALRHTWASLSIASGMPLMVVARNLGHRDTRMVEQHYGHLREDYVDKAVKDHAPDYGFEPPDARVRPLR
jgi:prepilin-type processing-associated H-X9-DG protein